MIKYIQTTVRIPEDTKKKVRILAAELGVPMGTAAVQLIEIGLAEYGQQGIFPGSSSAQMVSREPAAVGV